LGNTFECLFNYNGDLGTESQYVEMLSPPNNDTCYQLVGFEGQYGGGINNIRPQYQKLPNCYVDDNRCAPTNAPTKQPTLSSHSSSTLRPTLSNWCIILFIISYCYYYLFL